MTNHENVPNSAHVWYANAHAHVQTLTRHDNELELIYVDQTL